MNRARNNTIAPTAPAVTPSSASMTAPVALKAPPTTAPADQAVTRRRAARTFFCACSAGSRLVRRISAAVALTCPARSTPWATAALVVSAAAAAFFIGPYFSNVCGFGCAAGVPGARVPGG